MLSCGLAVMQSCSSRFALLLNLQLFHSRPLFFYSFRLGSTILKLVPVLPFVASIFESIVICPLCIFTIPYAVASPRPVPCPRPFVVKNGSNILALSSSLMPVPVSSAPNPALLPDWLSDQRFLLLLFQEL